MAKIETMAALALAALAAVALAACSQQQDPPGEGGDTATRWVQEDPGQAGGPPYGGQADGAAGEAGPGGSAEEPGEPEVADFGATDATSGLNSVQTAFDTSRAWPLSMTDKVAPLVGEEIAGRLFDDLNGWLAGAGASVADPVDVMVSEDGVERSEGECRFRVLAYHGADRIVVACAYGAAPAAPAFERMP